MEFKRDGIDIGLTCPVRMIAMRGMMGAGGKHKVKRWSTQCLT